MRTHQAAFDEICPSLFRWRFWGDWQFMPSGPGTGLGAGMLKDAVLRTVRLAQEMGIRALLCHAIDESAKQFYEHRGFMESPIDPLTLTLMLMLNIAKLSKAP